GDTIRVSLTEDPVKEIPVARAIAARAQRGPSGRLPRVSDPGAAFVADPYEHERRATAEVASGAIAAGGRQVVRAELELGPPPAEPEAAAWKLADAFAARREIACEGLRLDVADEAALGRAAAFAAALGRHGIAAPLALRMRAALAPQAKGIAARWIVPVE